MATVGSLNVVLNALTGDFNKNIDKSAEGLNKLEKATNFVDGAFDLVQDSFSSAGKAVEDVNEKVNDMGEKFSGRIDESMNKFRNNLSNITEEMNKMTQSVQGFNDATIKSQETTNESSNTLVKLLKTVGTLSTAFSGLVIVSNTFFSGTKFGNAIDSMNSKLGDFQSKMIKSTFNSKLKDKVMKSLGDRFSFVGDSVNKVKNAFGKFNGGLNKIGSGLLKLGSYAKIAGFALLAVISVKVMSAIAKYTNSIAQASLKTIQFAKSLKLTASQLNSIRDSAKAFGIDVGQITGAIKKVDQSVLKAQNGVDGLDKVFVKLGIDVNKFAQLPVEQRLFVLQKRIKAIDNEYERNQTFKKLGGDSLLALSHIDKLEERLTTTRSTFADLALIQEMQSKAMEGVSQSTKDSGASWRRLSKAFATFSAPFVEFFNWFTGSVVADGLSFILEAISLITVPLSKMLTFNWKFFINPISTVMNLFGSGEGKVDKFNKQIQLTNEKLAKTSAQMKVIVDEANKLAEKGDPIANAFVKLENIHKKIAEERAKGTKEAIALSEKLIKLGKQEAENLKALVKAQGEKNNAKRLEKMFSSSGLKDFKDFKELENEMERIRQRNLTGEQKLTEEIRKKKELLMGLQKLSEKSGKSQIKNEMILMEDITNLKKQLKEEKDKAIGLEDKGVLGQETDLDLVNTQAIAQSGLLKDSQKQVNEQKTTNNLLNVLIDIFKQFDLGLT